MVNEDRPDKFVMILGAGASAPFGFPTGATLKTEILSVMRDQMNETHRRLLKLGFTSHEMQTLANRFELSQVSIDSFVQGNPDLQILAKTAIAAIILRYETQSLSMFQKPDWYQLLFWMIKDDPQLKSDRLRIVTFNYDRSLEHYLATALANALKLEYKEAVERVERMEIVHFYGSLGDLKTDWDANRRYGNAGQQSPVESAKSLHLIRTGKSSPVGAKAIEHLKEATEIAIIGFGFDRDNLSALESRTWGGPSHPKIEATSQGLTNNTRLYASRVMRVFQNVGWMPVNAKSFVENNGFFARL